MTADDLALRVSEAADGEDAVRQVLASRRRWPRQPPPAPLTGARMRAEPTVIPVLPRYGDSTLADLASSLLASLGVPEEGNPLGLPSTARACLLVVDGLGWELLRDQPASAPFLSELAVNGAPLTAGFPATTVTSLSSLGTGRPPGPARPARLPGRHSG